MSDILIDSPLHMDSTQRFYNDTATLAKHPGEWQCQDLGRQINAAGHLVYRSRWSPMKDNGEAWVRIGADGSVTIFGAWVSVNDRRWTCRVSNITPSETRRLARRRRPGRLPVLAATVSSEPGE
jgi:hypothetical protein